MTVAGRGEAEAAVRPTTTGVARGREAVRGGALMLADVMSLALAHMAAGLPVVLLDVYRVDITYWDLFLGGWPFRSMQVATFGVAMILWFQHRGHYSMRLPAWTDMRHIVGACGLVMVTHGFLQFALKDEFSRLWLFHTWLLAIPCLIAGRLLVRGGLRRLGLWEMPALVVGTGTRLDGAVKMLAHDRALACRPVRTLDLSELAARSHTSWTDICRESGAEIVVVAADEADLATHRGLVSRLSLEGVPFIRMQPLGGLPAIATEAHYLIGQDVLLLLGSSPLSRPFGQLAKRTLDISGALAVLVLLAPLMLAIIGLLLCDGGPVFYRHRRVGWRGREFDCFKFRTMVRDAETILQDCLASDPARRAEWEQSRKLRDDPRITPMGRVIRRWSLDELPQLFNVLSGQMSLVGPRPVTREELVRHGADHPFYYRVRPGLTGLWQVSGRSDLDIAKRDELDAWYVTNWSLWLDLVILIKTIPAVFGRQGAY